MNRPAAKSAQSDPATLLAVVVCGLVAAGLFYLFSQERQASLNRSQVGYAGLQLWLKDQDVETLTFSGGGTIRPDGIGLRVLPLFDVDLLRFAEEPETEAENLQQMTEYDISDDVLHEKLDMVPSLVILPKWRRAVRIKGIAHPAFLIPEADVQRVRDQIYGVGGAVSRPSDGYVEKSYSYSGRNYTAGLYQPQFLSNSDCTPILGDADAMLLGECTGDEGPFWLLSDPDLLNAHGLTLAGNADLGRDVVAELAAGKRVIIDLTAYVFVTEELVEKTRSWADLGRFFTYPFSVLWIGFAILSALFLWRAWVRYGPIICLFEDGPRASKTGSIDATARLLRLSGHDRQLLQSHVAVRCRMLASDLLGPHRPGGADPVQELVRIVRQRAPELAQGIAETAYALQAIQHPMSHSELLDVLDRFETLYERTLHEFGRSAEPRPIHQG
ncbi:MAG TPA: hypothetical protein VK862_07050 [Afifellaceae bacterium]|nr:hypothetical protein [Afifellaceae bacterium]